MHGFPTGQEAAGRGCGGTQEWLQGWGTGWRRPSLLHKELICFPLDHFLTRFNRWRGALTTQMGAAGCS